MCWALTTLGYDDPRLDLAYEWMARSVTGEGLAPDSRTGRASALLRRQMRTTLLLRREQQAALRLGRDQGHAGLQRLPKERRTPLIEDAIRQGVDFLFSVDPAEATYPSGWSDKPSGNWWKFGFPVFYVTDILQTVEALVGLGYGRDPRLANALDLIREKQDAHGRWPLGIRLRGKTWVDFGKKKEPNKWVTLRALRVLKAVG
jgi:hypothetical protein